VTALAGKSVLVTGAARGIGAAIAEAVVDEGGAVALLDIDPAGAETATRLAERGRRSSSPAMSGPAKRSACVVAAAQEALGGFDAS
jgi:NAD(P)-dependent dehydrogenase (short-subunit alcohol dehydrogenase family)